MSLSNNTKLSLLPLALFTPTLALAANGFHNGYYAGASAGVLRLTSEMSVSSTTLYLNEFYSYQQFNLPYDVDVVNNYGIGSIYFGAGEFIHGTPYYWAIEFSGSWSKNRAIFSNASFFENTNRREATQLTSTVKTKLHEGEFAFDFKPGYLMDLNTMLYGRIGFAINRLKSTAIHHFDLNHFDPNTELGITLDKTKKYLKPFLRLGAGLEHKVGNTASLTADYIYTYYGTIRTAGTARDFAVIAGEDTTFTLIGNSKSKATTNALMLGIKYYFPHLP
ncbi:hypothetical protein [Candidatus Berkiella aquae]|uniref:Outer membrane protein beta-barrel domain-containing protein n=1 Tax=Candidatus Berkiella aquae TaxID=295108 RepID=A0A0Q9YUA8_9GAMM|nr:hypothetical protein [Candidatus Berkiella aquae]MCS5712191.1 hypothetical protein [Candidatus Berkiella aquae]